MKKLSAITVCFAAVVVTSATISSLSGISNTANAEDKAAATKPKKAAVERSRKTVQLLDNIFKQTVVLITDKYVHDEDDFAAGSAAAHG